MNKVWRASRSFIRKDKASRFYRFLVFLVFHLVLIRHSQRIYVASKMKHQWNLDWKSDLAFNSYGYWKCMFVDSFIAWKWWQPFKTPSTLPSLICRGRARLRKSSHLGRQSNGSQASRLYETHDPPPSDQRAQSAKGPRRPLFPGTV